MNRLATLATLADQLVIPVLRPQADEALTAFADARVRLVGLATDVERDLASVLDRFNDTGTQVGWLPAVADSARPLAPPTKTAFLVDAASGSETARACRQADCLWIPELGSLPEGMPLLTASLMLVYSTVIGQPRAAGPAEAVRTVTGTAKEVTAAAEAGALCVFADVDSGVPGEAALRQYGDLVSRARTAAGRPLFGSVEHSGIYATSTARVEQIAAWYERVFGWPIVAKHTIFLGRDFTGRIELLSEPVGEMTHFGVRVSDFDAALDDLRGRGIEVAEPVVTPMSKLAYLKDRDPVGNLVHLMWRPDEGL